MDLQVPFHSARVGQTVEIHYRWHAHFGQRLTLQYREARRGEVVFGCTLPDGTCAIIPAWMTDREACATLSLGAPRVALEALLNLRRQLDVLTWDRKVHAPGAQEGMEHDESERSTTVTATTGASHDHAAIGRELQGDRGVARAALGRRAGVRAEVRGTGGRTR